MFSDAERNLNQDTLEYAWLLEIQLGKLSGKATAPQVSFAFIILYFYIYDRVYDYTYNFYIGQIKKDV